jgi:hypothetical protein
MPHAWERAFDTLEQQASTHTVEDVRRVNPDLEQQSIRIHEDVTFASVDALTAVEVHLTGGIADGLAALLNAIYLQE